MTIARIQTDLYRIPLPRPLSDSTHREIPGFELITVRITTADGAEVGVIICSEEQIRNTVCF